MDEILASIRRIIESGDEGEGESTVLSIPAEIDERPKNHVDEPSREPNPSASAGLVPAVPPFEVQYHPTALGEDALVGRHVMSPAPTVEEEAAAGTAETSVAEDEAEPVPDSGERDRPESGQPAAAADVSDDAWWDAAVADANDVEADIAPTVADTAEGFGHPTPVNENDAVEPRSDPERPEAVEAQGDAEPAGAISDDPVPSRFEPREALVSPQIAAAPVVAATGGHAPKPAIPESVLAGASALLSAQAGDQVAAAFEDLTRAIREGQMRSMEGMAREIMRPMLQEWLDDNLPRIVERLVREEIERIARGPRR